MMPQRLGNGIGANGLGELPVLMGVPIGDAEGQARVKAFQQGGLWRPRHEPLSDALGRR